MYLPLQTSPGSLLSSHKVFYPFYPWALTPTPSGKLWVSFAAVEASFVSSEDQNIESGFSHWAEYIYVCHIPSFSAQRTPWNRYPNVWFVYAALYFLFFSQDWGCSPLAVANRAPLTILYMPLCTQVFIYLFLSDFQARAAVLSKCWVNLIRRWGLKVGVRGYQSKFSD